jgi:hypothetical protein
VEIAGGALGFVARRAKGDMERFKAFIEARGQETGAWRGRIPPAGEPTATDPVGSGTSRGSATSGGPGSSTEPRSS